MATIVWKGAEVRAKVEEAAKEAIDLTVSRCAEHAEANHPEYPPASAPGGRYANRTDGETKSISIFEEATLDGTRVRSLWGANARQSLFLEIGTSVSGPTAEERTAMAGGNMDAIAGPVGPLMAARPFLRPAADEEYPLLGLRVGAFYRGESIG